MKHLFDSTSNIYICVTSRLINLRRGLNRQIFIMNLCFNFSAEACAFQNVSNQVTFPRKTTLAARTSKVLVLLEVIQQTMRSVEPLVTDLTDQFASSCRCATVGAIVFHIKMSQKPRGKCEQGVANVAHMLGIEVFR